MKARPTAAIVFFSVLAASSLARAQPSPAPKRVTSEADLPRFSYSVSGSAGDLLLSEDAVFTPFLQKVSADLETILSGYDIEDKATRRRLLSARGEVQVLRGNRQDALKTLDAVRALEDKPEASATSGIILRSAIQASAESGAVAGPAFQSAFQKQFTHAVDALPWALVQDRVKSLKGRYQIFTPDYLVSLVRTEADPQIAKSQSIDFNSAIRLVQYRELLKLQLPIQPQIEAVLVSYIHSHAEQKPDIWPARSVTLTRADHLTPVRIGIWDSGVDTALFPNQIYTDPSPGHHSPHGVAFDTEGKPFDGDLQPLTAEQKSLYPNILHLIQGGNDLLNNVDTPAADAARKYFALTPSDQLVSFSRQIDFLTQYVHGTHVAGIAVQGNPAAEIVVAQFYDALTELPFAPSVPWANNFKSAFQQIGDYFREHNIRVVNMSWVDDVSEFETWLSKAGTDADPGHRKQSAGQIYAIWKEAIASAIRSAPQTLFVCAAGNSNGNAAFTGDVPASLSLPNLVTVGAVNQAGEETSFSSYGSTVVLNASGYQIESVVPGGTKMQFSGTSMASPNVVNLAAKLISLKPELTPEQTIALMRNSADTSANGRLHVINPKAAVALLHQQTP